MILNSYVPYKYAIEKLLALSSSKDQLDPSAYTILTAKSKLPEVSLTDFCAFTPKWINSQNSFRPPVRLSSNILNLCIRLLIQACQYYHRTMASEMMGMVYGSYGGSSKSLEPGALTCDNAYMPHGGIASELSLYTWYVIAANTYPQRVVRSLEESHDE